MNFNAISKGKAANAGARHSRRIEAGLLNALANGGTGVPPVCSEFGIESRNSRAGRPCHYSGVALVITLLMLSVITFLTVAFLALSRRERSAVSSGLDQTAARIMADTARARAESELILQMLLTNDILKYDLMVSTNYVNPIGFVSGISDPTNVNYDHYFGATNPLSPDDFITNIANLFIDARPPVFIKTNSDATKPVDFRFWLDYNRNTLFETNGWLPVMDNLGSQVVGTNGIIETNYFVGEPEWIGVRRNPEFPHSPTNQFIGRYCYLVLPAGKTLDLNYIHNYVKKSQLRKTMDLNRASCFLRNQGVGSWEMNYAAFLRDLNQTAWNPPAPDNYVYDSAFDGQGFAFKDALQLLRYRYGTNIDNLNSVASLFPNNIFPTDGFDGYTDGFDSNGSVDTGTKLTDDDDPRFPWSGADNTNMFYDMQELFDANKTGQNFVDRLRGVMSLPNSGIPTNSYDRYTFTRLLEGIGTDSAVEQVLVHDDSTNGHMVLRNKVNLNYTNDSAGAVTANNPRNDGLVFFTEAAELLLRSKYNFGVTNIPVYTNGVFAYSAEMNRMLQLAANIYDAMTNEVINGYIFPSVYKPIFTNKVETLQDTNGVPSTFTNVYIAGYTNVINSKQVMTNAFRNVKVATDVAAMLPADNVYGVPIIIGAKSPTVLGVKRGYPNFNECVWGNAVVMSRKVIFQRKTGGGTVETNQAISFGVTNFTGIELWNSYSNTFPRRVKVVVTNWVQMLFTNEIMASTQWRSNAFALTNEFFIASNTWKGFLNPVPRNTNNFQIALQKGTNLVSQFSQFLETSQSFITNGDNAKYEPGVRFPVHNWNLTVTNLIVYGLIDADTDRLLDFVNLGDLGTNMNISQVLTNENSLFGRTGYKVKQLWDPTGANGAANSPMSVGVSNQISYTVRDNSALRSFLTNNATVGQMDARQPDTTVAQTFSWQANDPLVHYTVADLMSPATRSLGKPRYIESGKDPFHDGNTLGSLNTRYSPWGGNPKQDPDAEADPTKVSMLFKDPNIKSSNDWDFPTNQFPSIGWLGRVHRGTPWQTIFLKSESTNLTERAADRDNWKDKWTSTMENFPTADWSLVDLFTTAPNNNAAWGLLSVNQTNLAPWSATLSGVVALTSANGGSFIDPVIQPDTARLILETAATNVVDGVTNVSFGINTLRSYKTNQLFHHIGDILEAPTLTRGSPFLGDPASQIASNLTDQVVERIPQQTLSLLKLGLPRFVIYSFGQALKPKDLASGALGQNFNICTNYQITGEVVTRTVCRVEDTSDDPKVVRPKVVVENFNVLPGE